MTEDSTLVPILDNVLYPSDFSGDSEVAFAHALKIALASKSKLTLIHVTTEDKEEWDQFPGVRNMLIRWELLPENSPQSAVLELGVNVRKVMTHASNPAHGVLKYQEDHHAGLIVIATHPHEGIANWFHESVSEPVARESGALTLFVPCGKEGFVSSADGSVDLSKILIPIASIPDPQEAVDSAVRMVERLKAPKGIFTLLHIGQPETTPAVICPEVPGWTWTTVVKEGDIIDSIVGVARAIGADLIAMSSDGPDGFLDTFRGSHSERVLHSCPCPLLIVPLKKES